MVSIGVVIPTRDRRELVTRAVRSVFAQTHRDFIVTVVDDASTDGTAEALRDRFAAECAAGTLRILVNERHRERSVSRNAGIAATDAPWIALLDDDDFYLPFHLELLAGAASAHPHLDILNSAGYSIDETNRMWTDGTTLVTDLTGTRPEIAFTPGILWGSTTLMRKAMFDRLGGFRTDLDFGEDTELFFRAAMTHRYGMIARPTVCRMVHGRSFMHAATADKLARCRERSWRLTEETARRLGFRIPPRARGYAWLKVAELNTHRPADARRHLREALRHDPALLLSAIGSRLALRLLAGERIYGGFKRLAAALLRRR